jgi:ubiquinone/menaquinone biosynthesis C-methylase UbiE
MDAIYDTIGVDYNATRKADPFIAHRLLHFLEPKPGKVFLDIGCGTGNYTIALANEGLTIVGIEPSVEMLAKARLQDDQVRWMQGTAELIPADEDSFDGVIATLTIHHWSDLSRSFKQISRVTKPGGRLIIFTATPEQMEGYWLNHYFPDMLRSSMGKMPSMERINEALATSGFKISSTEKYFVHADLQDNFLYSGKHNPSRYLGEKIRRGISSFAVMAGTKEVTSGLLALRRDIESGHFETIRNTFDDSQGDYIFIVAEKLKN